MPQKADIVSTRRGNSRGVFWTCRYIRYTSMFSRDYHDGKGTTLTEANIDSCSILSSNKIQISLAIFVDQNYVKFHKEICRCVIALPCVVKSGQQFCRITRIMKVCEGSDRLRIKELHTRIQLVIFNSKVQ